MINQEELIRRIAENYTEVIGREPKDDDIQYWHELEIDVLLIVAEKWQSLARIKKGK